MTHVNGEMFIFIRADSVLVHQRPSDSLMSGCPHITRLASERQLNRVEEGEEGGGTQEVLNRAQTLRKHRKAAWKSCSSAGRRSKRCLSCNR